MKFRKKPVVVEAILVSTLIDHISDRDTAWPDWCVAAFDCGTLRVGNHSVSIGTLEGDMVGDRTDWVIQGVSGELYPCKPDIFAKTYEQVEST